MRKLLISIFLGCLFVFLCAFRTSNPTLLLTEADNGKTKIVYQNTLVILHLPANASTGYSWTVTTPANFVLPLQSKHYIAPTPQPNHPPMVGVPGIMEFTFQAMVPGKVQLKLIYRRPWEKVKPAVAAQFMVTIRVKGRP
ncbi:inhibitor of cysteine peptidase [Dictyobacter alpinus]|uniref:Inhibitor of cysteine peptidase n=1 Tax=Dictyobacter alpinus TaxID=2014873 RepID=A0A402BKA0_9CHLR|nr:protease inhibitor I42 family protein [Dictyobacter alpinus]GCE31775.1 inhibitor of cysteine peptidase [Dictyobacter alpinus]